jgi:hypothetical protein
MPSRVQRQQAEALVQEMLGNISPCEHLWALYTESRRLSVNGGTQDQAEVRFYEPIGGYDVYYCQRNPIHMRHIDRYLPR